MASGRPERAGHITYMEAAERLVDNGFAPLPIVPGQKRPAPKRWSSIALSPDRIADWTHRYPDHGVGLRTGHLVGLDIDEMDPDRAHEIAQLAGKRLCETLVRVGQWPKRLLLYRTAAPFAKMKAGKVEVLGAGQQFVAFGLHSMTRRPYAWPTENGGAKVGHGSGGMSLLRAA
ncbi:bifunctional DNA primase/polymerase [Roseovarius sp. EGI FJ00037]|uniref:bifunctional DNA primase/polymerase n=1 Tax=Roseovarius salincola TaxID=2978479 RepID=UPI0022A84BE1|nr:bifunctional DNA primase/polymerase [Roseovarius sp. EGI FJ00037]MCZ0814375.1 bifunctional DNA primase/polymerase [Roseovarius sp. EGI FJ00037]